MDELYKYIPNILTFLTIIASVLTAMYGGTGAKWVEGKIGITAKRQDELAAIRIQLEVDLKELRINLKEANDTIDAWQAQFYKQKEDSQAAMQVQQALAKELSRYKLLCRRLVSEVNRARAKLNEPPLLLDIEQEINDT